MTLFQLFLQVIFTHLKLRFRVICFTVTPFLIDSLRLCWKKTCFLLDVFFIRRFKGTRHTWCHEEICVLVTQNKYCILQTTPAHTHASSQSGTRRIVVTFVYKILAIRSTTASCCALCASIVERVKSRPIPHIKDQC
jgi:hypothetical protein